MLIKQELFGFVVEIDKWGRAPVKLTFEEVYSRTFSVKKFYCCVDVGLYKRNRNRLEFERLGSFEIKDWFSYDTELKKRTKLKRLLGVETYNNLVYKMEKLAKGEITVQSKRYSVV